jgi:hypothetical protein
VLGQAVENVAVAFIRGRVPEFEASFAALLKQEGYWELGSIQVFSELATWTLEQHDDELVARVFAAVEFVKSQDSMRHGNDEAVEFYESIRADVPAEARERYERLWGEVTRDWMTSFGWLDG